ncbi:LytTR family DNA-binding domain-containing protein [Wenzhouxiangella limi]|nr:LytTR family DNA-binding domain-containing protein [Wenzhouxiangella limi]
MLGREFLVPAMDIEYAQAAGNYANLVVGGREYPLRSTMKGLLQRLDPERFRRVHRSYLVRIDQVTEIKPLESGDARLTLSSGAVVPCSRRYRAELS